MEAQVSHIEFPYVPPVVLGLNSSNARIRIEGFTGADYIARLIRQHNTFYELDLLEHLAKCTFKRGLVIDVGANIGNHTIYFAKFLATHVLAVEPMGQVVDVLQRNIQRNNLQNVTVMQRGAGSVRQTLRPFLPEDAVDNIGRMQLLDLDADQSAHEPILVQPLDEMVNEIWGSNYPRPVSLIKIDVEGMQMEVLHGAKKLISADKPDIVIEAPTQQELLSAQKFLLNYGYELRGKFCRTPTYHFQPI